MFCSVFDFQILVLRESFLYPVFLFIAFICEESASFSAQVDFFSDYCPRNKIRVSSNDSSVIFRWDLKNRNILEFELKSLVGVLLTLLNELIWHIKTISINIINIKY